MSADPFDQKTNEVVAEVIVLICRAKIAVGFEMSHEAQQLGGCAIAREIHPVVPRQAGLMRQDVEDCEPFGRHRIVQAKLRKIVTDRFGPVEAPFMVQQRHSSRGEGLGDRRDHELRCGGDRQICFNVALTIGLCEHDLAVLHHRDRCARRLQFGHGIGGKTVEFRDELVDRRMQCVRRMIHGRTRLLGAGALLDVRPGYF